MLNFSTLNEKKPYRIVNQYAQISFGVIILNIAFYFFLNPTKLVCGGMFGIATIIEPFLQQIGSWFTISIFLYAANIITLIIGGIFLGKDFFIKTVYASIFSPTVTLLLEKTCDPLFFLNQIGEGSQLLISTIISILLSGIGIGITVKNNGCTGGMDVVQRVMSKYMHVPLSTTMYFTDWVIVLIAGISFTNGVFAYNIEHVVYGVICVFGMSYIIDMLALNARSRRTVFTVTTIPHEIKDLIYSQIDRGVTFVDVTGGYSGEGKTMVVCTMEKNEAYRAVDLIKNLDPHAFTFVTSCKEVAGEYGRKGFLWK